MNPFDELELDPRLSAEELTELLRRRAEKAAPEDRERIQELWRALTMRESDRIRLAFLAHPRPDEAAPGGVETLRASIAPGIVRIEAPAIVPRLSDTLVVPQPKHPGGKLPRPKPIFDES